MSVNPPPEKPMTNSHSYPKSEAEYQEVVQNPDIFLQKLQDFHVLYGSKFRIPTLGGNHLDLHRLFVEVTSRGGIEKVIRDRRWKEVTGAFDFPSSITSASFVLRKYYLSLLYHFEQVYYFRKEEPSISVADQAGRIVNGSTSPHASHDGATSYNCSVSPNLEDGSLVTGTIDAKFDFGYLVTVCLDSENLQGVLYHNPEAPNAFQSHTSSADPTQSIRKRHQLAFKDPAHPKPNRSGYNFFFAEHYGRLKPLYHGQERAISKKIGELWTGLTEAEKQVYQEKGLRDKERYKAEMLEYKSSHHLQPQ
ncbi:High mobility group B protein 10 [Abeliophyllum distichum]|uniref:High mobility group B protein 10 n=1 Tax=Abeliophyllum distichum TaxID=126358 RepID=A0ABD1QLV9_9LAMI